MKRQTLIPAFIAIALFLWVPVAQASSPVVAVLSAEEGELTVGDPIELTLTVTHPANQTIIMPEVEANWGDLVVRSQSPATTVNNDDGTETTTQVIDVRLFAAGTFATPPLAVTVSDGAGQLSEVMAEPIDLTVTSVLIEGDTELRDIKPQAELPYSKLLPWLVGGFIVAAVAGGATILWWRRRRAHLAFAAGDNRLPHEVALDELGRIEKLRLPEAGRFKEHYTLVADCIRIYMERTLDVPVMERATFEVQRNLKQIDIHPDTARLFISFLEESDLVKFSKFRPDVPSSYELLVQARQLVEMAKPAVVESEPDAVVTGGEQKKLSTGSDIATRPATQQSEVRL